MRLFRAVKCLRAIRRLAPRRFKAKRRYGADLPALRGLNLLVKAAFNIL